MTIAILIAAAVALVAVGRIRMRHNIRLYSYAPWLIVRPFRAVAARRRGCDQGSVCKGRNARHGPCAECHTYTCSLGGYIDTDTLRRRFGPLCSYHRVRPSGDQTRARRQRRENDWSRLSEPIDGSRLVPDVMPEQYPGWTRKTLRAFMASDTEQAVVEGVGVSYLQGSIVALGLDDKLYAEQRDNETVLRRIA